MSLKQVFLVVERGVFHNPVIGIFTDLEVAMCYARKTADDSDGYHTYCVHLAPIDGIVDYADDYEPVAEFRGVRRPWGGP